MTRDHRIALVAAGIPEDRTLSPATGWTREHWEAVADATLAAAHRHASPGHALIQPPGPVSVSGRRSDGLEGFARTFLAAAFRLASPVRDPRNLAQWYADGLAAGVDPASPERWPDVRETPQARVEAASIVLALHETRATLWDNLDDRVRDQTVQWLSGVIGQPYPACNWLWFQNVVEAFLRSVGGPWSAEDIERNIAETERWYLADGWYTDGFAGRRTARNIDWYAGWAMNFYPLWYCRMSGEHADESLWSRYRHRLRRYLDQAQHLFAPDGPPLHQGRSLTYRYAALAPVWAGALFDATALPPGRTRRLASGVLRHFVAAGAWDDTGVHRIGWYGGFDAIRQPYSGPGSPYWSSKGFAGLMLPVGHPVWRDVEQPMEIEQHDVALTLPVIGWLVSGTRADGVVRVVNHGVDHADEDVPAIDDPGYSRHAYSTHTGPQYGAGAVTCPVDNHVALVDAAGGASHRRPLTPVEVRDGIAVSRHRAHWPLGPLPDDFVWPPPPGPPLRPGPWVTTASVLRGAVEVRLVRVDAAEPADGEGPWTLRLGGHPLAAAEPPDVTVTAGVVAARRADGLTSTVVGLRGLPTAQAVTDPEGSPYGPHCVVPFVDSGGPVRFGTVYAAAVILTGAPLPGGWPEVAVEGDRVAVRWPGGRVDEVRLAAPPAAQP